MSCLVFSNTQLTQPSRRGSRSHCKSKYSLWLPHSAFVWVELLSFNDFLGYLAYSLKTRYLKIVTIQTRHGAELWRKYKHNNLFPFSDFTVFSPISPCAPIHWPWCSQRGREPKSRPLFRIQWKVSQWYDRDPPPLSGSVCLYLSLLPPLPMICCIFRDFYDLSLWRGELHPGIAGHCSLSHSTMLPCYHATILCYSQTKVRKELVESMSLISRPHRKFFLRM